MAAIDIFFAANWRIHCRDMDAIRASMYADKNFRLKKMYDTEERHNEGCDRLISDRGIAVHQSISVAQCGVLCNGRLAPITVSARGSERESRCLPLIVLERFEPACFTSTTIVRPSRPSLSLPPTMPTVPDRQALEAMKRADLQRLCKVRPF